MKVCLVGSSGGHLTHLYMLKPFWKDKDRFWVTFDKEDARSLLEDEKMYPCYYPTTLNATDLFACSNEAGKYLFKDKPFRVLKNAIDSQQFIANENTRREVKQELGLK
ncbi:hypothetical protein [Blautia massiliensis (ex Durand et al. 2017)]|uniref:hypothetical protein n=1 Tax=Blautia massiliensis (ex Durand et al. 2017) TaxID=1737424 RepID=UPI0022DDD5A9|nr:hypothetical protein [Blautia massiliensis (ex Durand et al. 2017)]